MGTKHFYQNTMSASSSAANTSTTEFGNIKATSGNTVIWVGDDGQQAILTIDGFGAANKKQTGSEKGSFGGSEIWLDKNGYIWP